MIFGLTVGSEKQAVFYLSLRMAIRINAKNNPKKPANTVIAIAISARLGFSA
jgi:hypothetical protein